MILHEHLEIPDFTHIRLLTESRDVTISRGFGNIDHPVIWLNGDSASLTLGKPGMEGELIIDGGYLNSPPLFAHSPLIAISGPDSRLIMYDGVILQNNYNNGTPSGTSFFQNGAGVFIRTADNLHDRQAEFIMRGGIIRGNTNDVQTPIASGGGVMVTGFAVFTMEGGVIMDNTARLSSGGFSIGGRGSIRKTGGIIYGVNAPRGYRNTTLEGVGSPKVYGHAGIVHLGERPLFQFRNDTIGENDNLSYIGEPASNGVFGEGDNWDNLDKVIFRRRMITVILAAAALLLVAAVVLFVKKNRKQPHASDSIEIDMSKITVHEKKVLDLLFTDQSTKMIADTLNLTHRGVAFHCNKIYRKLNVKNRKELLVKYNRYQTANDK